MRSIVINKKTAAAHGLLAGGQEIKVPEQALSLPQITAGHVSQEQLTNWVTAAAVIHPMPIVNRLIQLQNSFSLDEVRALLAYDRQEHYPGLHASEVVEAKLFKRLPHINLQELKTQKFITDLCKQRLTTEIGASIDDKSLEKCTGTNGQIPWINAAISGLGEVNGKLSAIDVVTNWGHAEWTNTDRNIRGHYTNLVANNHHYSSENAISVNAEMSTEIQQYLEAAIALNNDKILNDAFRLLNDPVLSKQHLKLDIQTIDIKEDLLTEIYQTGQKHYGNVINGVVPELRQEKPIQLNTQQEEKLEELNVQMYASTQIRIAAERNEKEMKGKLSEFYLEHGINENFEASHGCVQPRKQDHFDAEGAGELLTERRIDRQHFCKPTIDGERLLESYKALGGDASPFVSYETPDKHLVQTVASEYGVDLSSFHQRKMIPLIPPKTRGAFHEKTEEFRDDCQDDLSKILETDKVLDLKDDPVLRGGQIEQRASAASSRGPKPGF